MSGLEVAGASAERGVHDVQRPVSYLETLDLAKTRCANLAQHLFELGLLGVELDEDNPPPVGLPLPGFQLNEGEPLGSRSSTPAGADTRRSSHRIDGSVVPLLMEDITLPLLCGPHFIKTSIDYVMVTSVFFKSFRRHGACHWRRYARSRSSAAPAWRGRCRSQPAVSCHVRITRRALTSPPRACVQIAASTAPCC